MIKAKKTKINIYAPGYYSEFKCIADKCRHSCCLDWQICIDKLTYRKYKKLKDIKKTVKKSEAGLCFALTENGRCPHLNGSGLCNIILLHGDDLLSDICKNHPRFFNDVGFGRREVGVGIVCEAACRLVLESEKPFPLVKADEIEGVSAYTFRNGEFDPLPQRDRIISVIQGLQTSFDDKLNVIMQEYNIPDMCTADEWIDRFLSLEILEADWERDLRSMKGKLTDAYGESAKKYSKYYERLLIYFVYRHVSTAKCKVDFSARLGFAILSVKMIRALFEADLKIDSALGGEDELERLADWARRYSAEIEYSEDNTDELIFAVESKIVMK